MSIHDWPDKRYFSEPFASWLRTWCENAEAREKAKANGTYKAPTFQDKRNANQPPSKAQIDYLKKLGATVMPMSKLEASRQITELVRKK